MNYYVYTDGAYSVQRGVSAWAYLILTDNKFIKFDSNKSSVLNNPTNAEDFAVGIACYTFLSEIQLTKDDRITFYCDSVAAIKLIESYLKGEEVAVWSGVSDILTNVKELHKVTKISFQKVKAHKKNLNPNTFVDRLVKYKLRG